MRFIVSALLHTLMFCAFADTNLVSLSSNPYTGQSLLSRLRIALTRVLALFSLHIWSESAAFNSPSNLTR